MTTERSKIIDFWRGYWALGGEAERKIADYDASKISDQDFDVHEKFEETVNALAGITSEDGPHFFENCGEFERKYRMAMVVAQYYEMPALFIEELDDAIESAAQFSKSIMPPPRP